MKKYFLLFIILLIAGISGYFFLNYHKSYSEAVKALEEKTEGNVYLTRNGNQALVLIDNQISLATTKVFYPTGLIKSYKVGKESLSIPANDKENFNFYYDPNTVTSYGYVKGKDIYYVTMRIIGEILEEELNPVFKVNTLQTEDQSQIYLWYVSGIVNQDILNTELLFLNKNREIIEVPTIQ